MESVLGVAAAAWGLVMALAPLLQIRRMILRRSSADLSLSYFGLLLPGFVLWVGYGLARGDWPLVVPNAVALAVATLTLVTGTVVRRRSSGTPASSPVRVRNGRGLAPGSPGPGRDLPRVAPRVANHRPPVAVASVAGVFDTASARGDGSGIRGIDIRRVQVEEAGL